MQAHCIQPKQLQMTQEYKSIWTQLLSYFFYPKDNDPQARPKLPNRLKIKNKIEMLWVTLLSGSAYAVPAVNDAAADLCDGAPGECESGGDCLRRVVGQGGYRVLWLDLRIWVLIDVMNNEIWETREFI
jgi:hypothetical protein